MKKELLELLGKAKDSISHHSPEILVACGITGMITATALAIKATPKAEKAIEEKKEELEVEHLTKIDLAKTVWKFYVPTIVLTIVSAGCLIGSVNISTRRTAALATAYQVIDTNYREYKEKVAETFGETKEKKVSNDVAQDKVTKNPVKKIKRIKQNKIMKAPYSDIEVEMIRDACSTPREKALVSFLFSTGARREEITKIKNHIMERISNLQIILEHMELKN